MTAGHSNDHKNVVLWDTLMPAKKCMVSSFACHENGASSIVYAPLNQILITGGKKGEVCIFDMRQRIQRDRFQAHEGAIKCIAMDPGEEFFATGSSDGDIKVSFRVNLITIFNNLFLSKVWSLMGPARQLLFSFMQEHTRSTFFRSMMGMGVSHLYIDNCGRLFSCGADGSMKMRHLPTVECQPKWFFSPTSPSTQTLLFGQTESGETGLRLNDSFVNGNGVVNTYWMWPSSLSKDCPLISPSLCRTVGSNSSVLVCCSFRQVSFHLIVLPLRPYYFFAILLFLNQESILFTMFYTTLICLF